MDGESYVFNSVDIELMVWLFVFRLGFVVEDE